MDIKKISPAIAKLLSDFENQHILLSHEELDLATLELIFQIGLIRYNLTESSEIEKNSFKNWLRAKMKELDTNDTTSAHGEKVIRRIGQNRIGEGSKYIEALIQQADSEFKKKQKMIARNGRRNHPLYELLEKIIRQNPDKKPADIYKNLILEAKRCSLLMPPDEDDTIDFTDSEQKSLKIKTVMNWISQLKKKFSR